MGTYKAASDTSRAAGNYQGMNWITQVKRLSIYLRDGMACAYCGASVESGAQLSLDHILPHSKGGTNHETNLVTCCTRCNSSRGNRELGEFIASVAAYVNHGLTAEAIQSHVTTCTARSLKASKVEAQVMIDRRGSAAKALAAI